MGELIQRQDLKAEVDFYGFCLQEADDTHVPLEYPEGRAQGAFLTAHEGRLDFESAGHTHTAALSIEVWDDQPPEQPQGVWDEHGRAQLHSPSGQLAVWGVAGGPGATHVDLPAAGRIWNVRAYCAGREEVRRLAQEGVPEGVERYLVQFWPTAE
ncbi:hypothetical protein ACF1G0_35055 [Streptomyces sp. NPDC013953]|uniref:hypothetical protein n=1 Tax=Streptomyces sp. NPDC013953 TaxID=3364868 RepID=UPI0036F9AB46